MRLWVFTSAALMSLTFVLTAAEAQSEITYCTIPATATEMGTAHLDLLLETCRPGDRIALHQSKPEWTARLCDFSKPITPAGAFTICQLANSVAPFRDVRGATSQLRARSLQR